MSAEAKEWIHKTFPAGFSSSRSTEKWLEMAFDAGQAYLDNIIKPGINEVRGSVMALRQEVEDHMKLCPLAKEMADERS